MKFYNKITATFMTIIFMVINFSYTTKAFASNSSDNEAFAIGFIIILLAFVFGYFLPSIIAFNRGHPNRWLIFVINAAFGVTFFGWLICLVWALNAIHKPIQGEHGGQSGLNLFVNDEKRIRIVNEAPSTETVSLSDHIRKLEQLKSVFDKGGITQDEYDSLRSKILSNIK